MNPAKNADEPTFGQGFVTGLWNNGVSIVVAVGVLAMGMIFAVPAAGSEEMPETRLGTAAGPSQAGQPLGWTGGKGVFVGGSGSQSGSGGSTTQSSSSSGDMGRDTPLVYKSQSSGPPVFDSGVWTGDEGGVEFVQTTDQQGNPTVSAVPETPSNWTRLGGVFGVIGGLGEAAIGGTGVFASGVGTFFRAGSAAPVSIPLLFGSSVLTLHGIDQAWAGFTTVYWGTRQRPIAAQSLDRVTGNETASDVLNGVAGAAMTGGVGLAIKGAVWNSGATTAAAGGGAATGGVIGAQAVVAPGLGAGTYPALIIDGVPYVARFHIVAWELAGKTGVETFYGAATIDAAGRVIKLIK